jgi:CubicO group peptidase (beta-lactamase class C family)
MTSFAAAFNAIAKVARAQIARDQIPGMALAITSRKELVYDDYFGEASLEAEEPVRPDHLFEIGSIGKSFTCILLLQLAEEGLLSFDEPVRNYLPWLELQSTHPPITLHHLMTHSAGIFEGTDFATDRRFEVWALRETPVVNPPGERYHYSNVGYKALGLVLEAVTGESYPDLIQRRILDPLGMQDSVPAVTHAVRERLATGYRRSYDDRPAQQSHGHVPATWLETDTADGCIACTARDLATYLRMLMNGGKHPGCQLLSAESFEAMTTPYIADDEDSSYGYGLNVLQVDDRHYFSHGGSMVGYFAHMIWDATTEYGALTLINGPGRQGPVTAYALDAIGAVLAQRELPEFKAPAGPFAVEDAADYAKTYRSDDETLQVMAIGYGLCLALGDEVVPLESSRGETFLADHPEFDLFPLQFFRDADGVVAGIHHGERTWLAPGADPPSAELPERQAAFRGHYRTHVPWQTNFRIIARSGLLLLVWPNGREEELLPAGDDRFQIGDRHSPEFIHFDAIVDGEAWRANLGGCDYYRFFTP